MVDWHIRRLGLAEMDAAAEILRAAFDAALPHLAGIHTPAEDRWFFRQVLYPAGPVWGAFRQGTLAGIMATRTGWIEQLYVAPEEQGRGCGQALLRVAMADGAPLELWTFQCNGRARRFYERLGFRAVEFTDGARNQEKEPDVRYRWEGGGR